MYTVDQAIIDWNKPRWEVISIFKSLQAAGVAIFIWGRRGHPSRLQAI